MEKKKRSRNFTNEEKENLLSIVAEFKNVIECKKTGACYLQKKKDAWLAVTQQYNSLCTSGPRDVEMLRHFYNNIKHRARKVSASENKQRYMKELDMNSTSVSQDNENIQIEELELPSENKIIDTTEEPIFDENYLKELKRKWADDKKNIKKTGGGSYNPTLTDADHQVLSILDDQIHPDANPLDEAADYFGDTSREVLVNNPVPDITIPAEPQTKIKNSVRPRIIKPKVKPQVECRGKSAELLKKIYFKKKIELVFYQKKNEMLRFRAEKKNQELIQRKHELDIKILQMQLQKLQKE